MKKNKILLIILPILLVLICLVVLLVLYFTTDIFKSNDKLFAKYFVQNGEIFDLLDNKNETGQSEFKKANSYIMTGDLSVSLQNGANSQELNAVTSSRHDATSGRTYADITKAKNLIGYNPKTEFKEGINNFIKWLTKMKKNDINIGY